MKNKLFFLITSVMLVGSATRLHSAADVDIAEMRARPWVSMIDAINAADVDRVKLLVEQAGFDVLRKRDLPGAPSHEKTALQIATFNLYEQAEPKLAQAEYDLGQPVRGLHKNGQSELRQDVMDLRNTVAGLKKIEAYLREKQDEALKSAAAAQEAPVRDVRYGQTATKVGIMANELARAKELAYEAGQLPLMNAIEKAIARQEGRKPVEFKVQARPKRLSFEADEKADILWPVYVWAIENDDLDLFRELRQFIPDEEQKPYGRVRPTARELANYHKSKGIIAFYVHKDRMTDPSFALGPAPQDIAKAPWSWFALATETGNFALAKDIIEQGLLVINELNARGNTPLDVAIYNQKNASQECLQASRCQAGQATIIRYLRGLDGRTSEELE